MGIDDYEKLTSDYSSVDFLSDRLATGYPIHINVNRREGYAYCEPAKTHRTDEESKTAYANAYNACIEYGRQPCKTAEDFNKIAYRLADTVDYEKMEITEGLNKELCLFEVYSASYYDNYEDDEEEESDWDFYDSKEVTDIDGFTTEYTMYVCNLTDESREECDYPKYICMFGDRDLYPPDVNYADWSGDTKEEADEWFESYHGYEEDFEQGTGLGL